MDGTAAINSNIEALKGILAGLFAMAGVTHSLTSHLRECRREASDRGWDGESTSTQQPDISGPPLDGQLKPTLPRHLRLAILRLLRPAEAAARRLIIAAARGLVVIPPPSRKRTTPPLPAEPLLRRFGIAVVLSPDDIARAAAIRRAAANRAIRSRRLSLPLFDPPRRISVLSQGRSSHGASTVRAHATPRILFPGAAVTASLPPPPRPASPDDPVDATHLRLRLAALSAALADMPGQARRFARWQALSARQGSAPGRLRRLSPLRPGRPPGGRLSRFDPSARRGRNIRDVDEILAHAHALAHYALQPPDTS